METDNPLLKTYTHTQYTDLVTDSGDSLGIVYSLAGLGNLDRYTTHLSDDKHLLWIWRRKVMEESRVHTLNKGHEPNFSISCPQFSKKHTALKRRSCTMKHGSILKGCSEIGRASGRERV